MSGNIYKPSNETPNANSWNMLSNQPDFGQNVAEAPTNRSEQKGTEMNEEQYLREREKEVEYVLLTKDYDQVGKFAEGFTERDEREFFEHVLNDNVSYEDEMALISKIRRPDEMGISFEETLGELKNGENPGETTKVLFLANGGTFGSDGKYRLPLSSVGDVVKKYKTAIDFYKIKDSIVDQLTNLPKELGISITKEAASTAFCDVCEYIYGMQGEYANTMARVAEKAAEYADNKEFRPIWEDMNSEKKLFKSAAVCVTSKEQIRNGKIELGVAEREEDGFSQDAAYGSGEENVFAVFDGVGGSDDGRAAARNCMEKLPDFMDDIDFTTENGKNMLINALNRSIEKGGTTGVVTKITQDENGKKFLHYASVGDSRLYIIRKNGGCEQITDDDNFKDEDAYAMAGGYLTMNDIAGLRKNAEAGQFAPEGSIYRHIQALMLHGVTKSMDGKHNVSPSEGNAGVVPLESGDQIMLCSDGITGDVPSERLFTGVIDALVRGRNADIAVNHLMRAATKFDDRTAMVINV